MSIFTTPLPEAVEALVAKLAADEDIVAMATATGGLALTTRGGYGRWMGMLPRLAEASPLASSQTANLRIWAVILDRAGADRQGLTDALRILGA